MKIYLIAIGGSAMHNLAIALKNKGFNVSGSDDEVFEPSRSRLLKHGLLPAKEGWDADRITNDIDVIILGMHARKDNPELQRALQLGLKVYSYPEYFYNQTKDKKRVVISGSHGKTTITSMVMHVLNYHGMKFDYLVGAQIEGFETMVRIDDESDLAIIEGDEYLSSPIDRRPKFHWYKPDVAVLTGIAWDHINVFPTFDDYVRQFSMFVELVNPEGCLIWYGRDENLKSIIDNKHKLRNIPYIELKYEIIEGATLVYYNNQQYRLPVFGAHNMQNLNAALLVCNEIGVDYDAFFSAIVSFKGAAKRLQLIAENMNSAMYIDFAHAPSKLQATIKAMKENFPKRFLVACIELHTFSSLNPKFLSEYKDTMRDADEAIVYFNPDVLKHKQLDEVSPELVAESFGGNIQVFVDSQKLQDYLKSMSWDNKNLLMMSSGNFNGIQFDKFGDVIINQQ
jgi:UDP-N-acetylmuramate: L-alanyl-gamma-D-glutamyl-meso-diaminopimelate ligase